MTDLEGKLRTLERSEPPELWTEIERRAESSPAAPAPRRRWPAAAVALGASALSLALVVGTFVRPTERHTAGSLNAERIDVGIDYLTTEVDVGEGRVWVLTTDPDFGWVVASIDPVTLEARRFSLGVGDGDGALGGLAVGGGSVWVTFSPVRDGSYDKEPEILFHLDPETGEIVDQLTVGRHPAGIAVTDGVVWVAEQAENRVVRIDASSGEVLGSTEIVGPARIVAAFGWVWVETAFDDPTTEVIRLDPSTGEITGTVDSVHNMSVGLDAMFVSEKPSEATWQLDSETLRYGKQVTGPTAGEFPEVVAGDGQVWLGRWFEEAPPPDAQELPGNPVRYGDHRFYRVDPRTFEPTGEVVTTCPSPGRAAIAFGSLWYPCLGDVFRVPLTNVSPPPETANAVFFPTWSGSDRPLALITGVLVERDGCLLLRTGGDDVLLLWEASYSYAEGTVLDSSGEIVARPGDAIQGGGGYGSDWGHAEEVTGTAIPERCRPDGVEPFALIYDLEPLSETPASEATDIGLGFPVCDISSVDGDFGSGSGTAYIATRMSDTGGCPTDGGGLQVLAVDVSGDGIADGSYVPLECDPTCRTFAAPDVDADGIDEIAVAVGATGGSTLFELYAVADTTLRPLRHDCVECNEGTFAWGRPGGHAEGVYCPSNQTPGDFVVWYAEQTDDGSAYAIVEIFIDVKGSFLTEVDQRDSEVPFEASALPPGGGDDFCGAPVVVAAVAG